VDSPLTSRVTEVFRLHPECYDAQARKMLESEDSPFEFEQLHYVGDPEQSKALDRDTTPSVIVAASGMCEFGRVVHHLRAHIGDERSSVVIVGFQAQHTLGRRLVEGRRMVPIFGVKRERRCEVVVLNGFSAHADHDELVSFVERVRAQGPLRTVVLVHGEDAARRALAEDLGRRGFPDVRMPGRPHRPRRKHRARRVCFSGACLAQG
jgi:metallo-beta-lactamase family protein